MRAIDAYLRQFSSGAPARILRDIASRTDQISLFPESGRVVPELGQHEVREVFHGDYRIIYGVRNNNVRILRVLHGASEFPGLEH